LEGCGVAITGRESGRGAHSSDSSRGTGRGEASLTKVRGASTHPTLFGEIGRVEASLTKVRGASTYVLACRGKNRPKPCRSRLRMRWARRRATVFSANGTGRPSSFSPFGGRTKAASVSTTWLGTASRSVASCTFGRTRQGDDPPFRARSMRRVALSLDSLRGFGREGLRSRRPG